MQEEQANAQLRWIPVAQGGGTGIYATEDIWHGQKVMLVNQEQTKDLEEDPRHSLVEESELSQEWEEDGNPQGQGADTEGSREPSPSGDSIEYSPMESLRGLSARSNLATVLRGWRPPD